MEQNLNKQPDTEKIPGVQTDPTRDINGYAEKFLLRKKEMGLEIGKKEQELEEVVKQSMDNPKATKESYTRLISLIKNEIEILKFKRDNLHNETIH